MAVQVIRYEVRYLVFQGVHHFLGRKVGVQTYLAGAVVRSTEYRAHGAGQLHLEFDFDGLEVHNLADRITRSLQGLK